MINIFSDFYALLITLLKKLQEKDILPQDLDCSKVAVELPREKTHGDMAINAAMVLAKQAGMQPRALAEILVKELKEIDSIQEVEIAGPGFINICFKNEYWISSLEKILKAGPSYGSSEVGQGIQTNVEYVSVNPTGPMHAGHGRVAVVGDALAALLEKAGYKVIREFYINDGGGQADTLARSLYIRYLQTLGDFSKEIPEGGYPGEYLIPVGEKLAKDVGQKWQNQPEEIWLEPMRDFAVCEMMVQIKKDLALLGIYQDVFSSERDLVQAGRVEEAVQRLAKKGLVYEGVLEPPKGKKAEDWEPKTQLLFKSTDFGDDQDRTLKKSDGSWTYFAKDIAYHYDKYKRGCPLQFNIWGADHGGYVKRIKAAFKALTDPGSALEILLCQIVNLTENGVPVKMSKRAGTFVTLEEVVERVGKDVVRLMMLSRRTDAQLDFDFAKVTEQSQDNPVFYIQYAYARICSVKRQALKLWPDLELTLEALLKAPLNRLEEEAEIELIKLLSTWPRQVETAALVREPHRIVFFLQDVAAAFHSYWNKGKSEAILRFIVADDQELTRARLALLEAIALVIHSGLVLCGVEIKEEMK